MKLMFTNGNSSFASVISDAAEKKSLFSEDFK